MVALARVAELCRNVWDGSPGGKVLSIQRYRKVYNDRLIEKPEISALKSVKPDACKRLLPAALKRRAVRAVVGGGSACAAHN